MNYDSVIVGAGPAGSTAAITMARAGLKVALFEAEVFPRHKLCGEFLSGEGVAVLKSLGLDHRLRSAGASSIREVVATSERGSRFKGEAPPGALSLSRYILDDLLIQEADNSGADVFTGEPVRDVQGSIEKGFTVSTPVRQACARSLVCASGRNGRLLSKLRGAPAGPVDKPLVAFKTYYEGDFPPHRVELHAFDGGYCGLQRVETGAVNACWVTRSSVLTEAGGKPLDMVDMTFEHNRSLRTRLEHFTLSDPKFLAVSNLDFRPKAPVASGVLMVGDSAGMIAPLAGDGMSMAITSASRAARLVEAYCRGALGPKRLLQQYAKDWTRTYRLRMMLAAMLHGGMERPIISSAGIALCRAVPSMGRWLAERTRG